MCTLFDVLELHRQSGIPQDVAYVGTPAPTINGRPPRLQQDRIVIGFQHATHLAQQAASAYQAVQGLTPPTVAVYEATRQVKQDSICNTTQALHSLRYCTSPISVFPACSCSSFVTSSAQSDALLDMHETQ